MSANSIRNALGLLQDDPDRAEAWAKLREALGVSDDGNRIALPSDVNAADTANLLEQARASHASRREHDAVAGLLAFEAMLARGSDREAGLVAELGRVRDEETLDDAGARAAYERLLELRPGDAKAEEFLETSDAKQKKWTDIVAKYVEEAKQGTDPTFKASMLVGASEVAYRFGRPQLAGGGKKKKQQLSGLVDEVISGLREAVGIDPKSMRALHVLERVLRTEERWDDLAVLLERRAESAAAKDDRIAGLLRLARVLQRKMNVQDRAMDVYAKVLDLQPANREATSALVDLFTAQEKWEELVSLYDGQLATLGREGQAGTILQIAMVQWKMRNRPDAAEPYFERLRKLEPAHPGMLGFFREWCPAHGETARLGQVLTDASRALPEGAERMAIVAEMAKINEESANASKAIEGWRNILRQDPVNKDARDALKRLYRQSGGWSALTDLLRSELERVPPADTVARLGILREIAGVYKDAVKSDSALVTVLTQIVALDTQDVEASRDLARVHEALGRWRDLLTTQAKLADLETDKGVKVELYRAIARRWLDQFSNVQNALEAYEKLAELAPDDSEAIAKLRELYTKRRAFKSLYDLLERQSLRLDAGPARREVWAEMAKIAAERLDRGVDAAAIYRKLLDEDSGAPGALDALEKQAERDKDWKTVAEVVERRVKSATDDAQKLVFLQKLGAVYTDRLQDMEGAKSAWRRVLELQPGHPKALRVLRDAYLAQGEYEGLADLYVAQGDFEGLAEVLSSAADKATDPTLKVELSYRAADVYVRRLKAPERAFRAYERILSSRPGDARAAAALVPLYEKEEKWARLPPLYEVLLSQAESDEVKLRVLERLAHVTGHQLGDRAASFAYARRAYELAAKTDPNEALAKFEAAAQAAGAWSELVEALETRRESAGKDETRTLRSKIAEVHAREGQIDDAVRGYRALVEEDEKDDAALHALDRILRGADRRDDLRWLFDRRIERGNDAQKIELLGEWAALEEDAFQAPEKAIALYRRILEVEPTHGAALRSLARLLRAAGDLEGAVEILAKERDERRGKERAACEIEIAQLDLKLKKPVDALAAAKRALELAKNDAQAIAVVEELLTVGETRAAAAVVLDESYGETNQLPRQAEVLEVRIATAAAKEDRLALYGRLADVHEKLNALGVAFDVVARAAREFPIELPLWDRLAVLAQRTKRSQHFVAAIADAVPPAGETGLPPATEIDLSERAATLYEEMLGEPDRARPYLERILAREPTNDRAFGRLKQILTARERWDELEVLYERVVTATADEKRQAELLSEIALIAEEITGDKPKATSFYERILALHANDERAMRALDSLYASQERWPDLASLLERRVKQASEGGTHASGGRAPQSTPQAYKLRLGTLRFAKLNDPKGALDELEDVLLQGDGDAALHDARDIVEKCLEVPTLRARAAVLLERVYASRDETRDLVRVLEIRLESVSEASEKRELLRRVAELRDEKLSDDAGAFEAYGRFVPLAPTDDEARKRLLAISRRIGAHERAAGVLLEAAEVAEAPQPRADILRDVASIYEEQIKDPSRAEGIHRRVLEIDPDDAALALPAAQALERIYAASGRNAELAKMLGVQVALESHAEKRRELLARLGELSETVLAEPAGAIAAWKQRLEDDPADEKALVALDRLYERQGEWRALVDVLRARERGAADKDARRPFMVRAAGVLAEKLTDVPEAILAYRAVLDDFGADKATLSSLETLYEIAERWNDLAEALEAHLGLAEGEAEKIATLARLGKVRQEHTSDLIGALDAYGRALAIDGSHPPSRAALEALLDDKDVKLEAAGILRPLYEKDGEHARLLRVLEIEADLAEDPESKLAVLRHAVKVAEGPLHDAARAWGYAARGLREAASGPAFGEWLGHAERITESTADYAALVTLLQAVIPEIADSDAQLEVTLKVAGLARGKLADANRARDYYAKALEQRGDEKRALEALESIYEDSKDAPALLEILKKRADVAATDDERKVILFKQARLSDETMRDARAATETYETILSISLDPAAISTLERLYADATRWDDLVALHERELGATNDAARKADLHFALGRVHEKRLTNFDEAFAQYEAALKVSGNHAATVEALEALMGDRAHSAQAAEMLEGVYLARLDWRRVMTTLEARLAVSEDPEERRELLRRLSKLHEEQGEDYRAALDTTAKLLSEDVTDETTWAELERLARVANAEARLAEIFAAELEKVTSDEPATARLSKRTGELYEALAQVDRALHFYRRAHAFAPEESDGTFEAIDRLLREAKRPAERVALYRKALEWRDDPKERMTTLHTIALLEEVEIGDDDKAIETYRASIDVDESDLHSLEALSRLYARRERWRDLADLTRKRAEQSALPDDEAKLRLELGRLLEHKLDDPKGAIDEYQATTDLAPPPADAGKQAVLALEAILARGEHKPRLVEILRPLYERADDWQKLVSLNDERLTITEDASEKVTILRETSRLYETRGNDAGRAFDAVRVAFVLDPDDGETRGELDRLAEATKRWDALADAYEQGIAKTEGIGQRELLGALARVHDKRRDDPRRALDAWDRLWKQDESDIEPLEEMDSLATLVSDWTVLVRVLVKKAELLSSDEDRASTWRRVGEAKRDMLDDLQGAIDAYERALELEPASTFTLDNLIPLYEQKSDAARLVDLYRRRIDLCGEDDEGLKFELLVAAATHYETGLEDRKEAIALLNEALNVRQAIGDVLKRLDVLYTHERMWPELLENLRMQAASAQEVGARRFLTKRIGALLAGQLDDAQHALEAYREVLTGEYDTDSAAAIRKIGEEHEELRLEAAEALEPVLGAASMWSELADALEMRLRAQTEPAERAKTLRSLAETHESRLANADRALDAILRALAEEPHDAKLHDDAERLAERIPDGAGWGRYAGAIDDRAANLFDAQVTTDLYVRLGRVAEEKLSDDARAAKAYAKAAEQAGDTPAILAALDRLYGRLKEARLLSEVLERRIAIETDVNAQAELFHRLASLQIHEFADQSRGLATLRQALERDPRHVASRESVTALLAEEALFDEAFDALEWVYRQLSQAEELAALYARRVTRAMSVRDKARARMDLARVLEVDAKDAQRAQRVIEEAMHDDPADVDLLLEVERLAPLNEGGWKKASDALDRALGEAKDVSSGTRGELWLRLATWRRDRLSDARGAEDAFVHALGADPENLEVLRSIESLRRAPGRERDLVATLRQRAKLEAELPTKRELLREARALAALPIADAALAEEVLRDLLAEDEGDRWALGELVSLRETAGDWKDVAALLLRLADLENAREMADVQHRAAKVIVEKLDDLPRAIGIYEGILEQDPSDRVASQSVRELYVREGRDKDLAKLLELLVETSASSSERALHRLDLAQIQEEKFGAPRDAVETLRAILEEEPTHEGAVRALSTLLEKTGQDEELAELLASQIERARERGDLPAEMALRVRLAETYELRLKDTPRALGAYEAILEREPTHRKALEAVARLSEGRAAWDRAATALAKLVELGANGTDGVLEAIRLAKAREQLGDTAGVEAALRRALEIQPANAGVREDLRALYEREKKWDALAALLVGDAELVAAANPDAVPAPQLVAPAQSHSIPPPGRASVPPAATLPPPPQTGPIADQVRLLRRAAEIHLKERGAPGDAVPILERATALTPTDRELMLLLCDAYSAASRPRDAANVLEKVIASFGNRRTKELSVYHHRLGRALASLGDKDIALSQFDMAFKIDPGSVGVLKDLGVLALETNDLDRAQKTFRALLLQRLDGSVGISKGEVFYYLGEISAKQGDKQKAVQMLERAIENEPTLDRAKAKLSELKG
jgi:tetratricopeptide (TPR) repeat protein